MRRRGSVQKWRTSLAVRWRDIRACCRVLWFSRVQWKSAQLEKSAALFTKELDITAVVLVQVQDSGGTLPLDVQQLVFVAIALLGRVLDLRVELSPIRMARPD